MQFFSGKTTAAFTGCAKPQEPHNGKLGIGHNNGNGILIYQTFLCNDDYDLVGPSAAVCRDDGKWTKFPTCKKGRIAFHINAFLDYIGVTVTKEWRAKKTHLGLCTLRHLVRPMFEYAAPVWDACSQHDTIAMERFQLSIARAMLHVHRRQMHNVDVLATIGWPTLAWCRRRQKLSSLWDLLHGGGPPSLRSQVPSPVSSRCSYSFRNPLTLSLPSCRTSRRLKSFLPSSVALFNSLPMSVVCCSSKRSFLKAVDKFFLPDKFSYGLL